MATDFKVGLIKWPKGYSWEDFSCFLKMAFKVDPSHKVSLSKIAKNGVANAPQKTS